MQRAPEWREIRDEDNESTFHIKVSFDLDLENAIRQIIANKRKKDRQENGGNSSHSMAHPKQRMV